jgi:arylsulfatase A-like enzyme
MITLDCVRPDHLGCFGYRGVDTPNIDRAAEEGVRFDQAIAQAPNTWVSHASIFTGCNPYRTGVRTPFHKLLSNRPTLAEMLQRQGFATAGFPAHTLLGPANGFDRGFDFYDLDRQDFKFASGTKGNYYYRDWPEMWAKALKWMDNRQERPQFLWFHYMGTHEILLDRSPVPLDFLQKYSPVGQYYDGKISWADSECVGTIYSYLEEKSLLDDSLLVLFSDHGERLTGGAGENDSGRAVHNDGLEDDVMKITWIMRSPGLPPGGTVIDRQVRSIDMMPTILSLAGAPVPGDIDGCSLVPMLNGKEEDKDCVEKLAYAYMENVPRSWLGIRSDGWKLVLTGKKEEKKRSIAARAWGRFKRLIGLKPEASRPAGTVDLHVDAPARSRDILNNGRAMLYNLDGDPGEKKDVSPRHGEVAAGLKDRLREMIENGTIDDLEELNQSDEEEVAEKLEGLGYL